MSPLLTLSESLRTACASIDSGRRAFVVSKTAIASKHELLSLATSHTREREGEGEREGGRERERETVLNVQGKTSDGLLSWIHATASDNTLKCTHNRRG